VPANERTARARAALEQVGLGQRLDHQPSQLSGGQQQRVAVARALVTNPSLILADEPTGNLDSQVSAEVMALFQALNRRGLTIVLVTHEDDIAAYAHRVVRMRDGRMISDETQVATIAQGANHAPAAAPVPDAAHLPDTTPHAAPQLVDEGSVV
jgi:putative ABC transport system ATP-binding protein